MSIGASHQWRFFRAGGFDQVRLDTAADLLSIGQLDQKLWVALSCPVKGIEFDSRTLEFIDADADGQVRAPELIAAVQWVGERLKDHHVLTQHVAGVPIPAIRTDDEEGARIHAAALAVAAEVGKTESDLLTVEETSTAQAVYAAKALADWEAAGVDAQVLGEATADAHTSMLAVAEKINDFFLRCQLAAFDPQASEALNASLDDFKLLAQQAVLNDTSSLARLPLAHIAADAQLPLGPGSNPAWSAALVQLREVLVQPLLGERERMSAADWESIRTSMAPYATWLAGKPDPASIGDGVRELERLSRYVRDLHSLANNFVAFKDFYTGQGKATFQLGTLYLDGRSCDLCVSAADAAKHGALAGLARICLVYCACTRGAEKQTIAAAFTAGDSDQLMVGRNGVFYDRQGRDWDATIVKMVEHPISLRQAFWSPYKQVARLMGDQMQKIAASKAKASQDGLNAAATDAAQKAEAAKHAGPSNFDVGKFAGIFAALGLAVGALGTALATMVTGLFALKWWQLPLAVVGVMLVISGPAVLLAWFKLRSRNLGPILDANGWAINARARINIPFGTSLTQVAALPPNAQRSMSDPYAEKPSRWPYVLLVLAILAGAALYRVYTLQAH